MDSIDALQELIQDLLKLIGHDITVTREDAIAMMEYLQTLPVLPQEEG